MNQQNFISAAGKIFNGIDRKGMLQRTPPHISVAIAAAMVVLLVAVLWYSYPKEAAYQDEESLPLVRAEAGAFRMAPDDPGGMDIPYRDSTVFETLRSQQNTKPKIIKMENLLSKEEEPVDKDSLFAGLKTGRGKPAPRVISVEPSENKESVTETKVPEVEKTAALPVKETAAPAPQKKPVETPAPMSVPEAKKAEPVPEPAPAPVKVEPKPALVKQAAIPSGDYYVQLGSLRTEELAKAQWKEMQGTFPALLGALSLKVQKVDLGARGVYYRVQGGGVSKEQAKSICAAITEKKPGGCLVVNP